MHAKALPPYLVTIIEVCADKQEERGTKAFFSKPVCKHPLRAMTFHLKKQGSKFTMRICICVCQGQVWGNGKLAHTIIDHSTILTHVIQDCIIMHIYKRTKLRLYRKIFLPFHSPNSPFPIVLVPCIISQVELAPYTSSWSGLNLYLSSGSKCHPHSLVHHSFLQSQTSHHLSVSLPS